MSVRGSYLRIGDQERAILVRYFNEGMTSKGASCKKQIQDAVKETGLSEDRIKKWIGNEMAKKRASLKDLQASADGNNSKDTAASAGQIKPGIKRTYIKGQSKFNAFCSDFFTSDFCAGLKTADKNIEASKKWKAMSEQEREQYSLKAKEKNNPDLSKISEEDRNQLIKKHKKQLEAEITILQEFGCEFAASFKEPSGQVFNICSAGGDAFMRSNPDVVVRFKEHFHAHQEEEYTYEDLTKLFNEKYSTALGKFCRVPYQKGGFTVTGLPDGLPFRKPSRYGSKQLKSIMEKKDDVVFHILKPTSSHPQDMIMHDTGSENELHLSLLTKVCGMEVAKRVLKEKSEVQEENVEVFNLVLDQNEFLALHTTACKSLFHIDAWIAAGANLQHASDVTGLILPIYTESEEQFWLFYSPTESPAGLVNKKGKQKIQGFWLDIDECSKAPTYMYKILPENKQFVYGRAVVRSEIGPIYIREKLKISEGETFTPPDILVKCVLDSLARSGFLN